MTDKPHKPNKPGTPPNTSLVLTKGEMEFIRTYYGGDKSRAIHDALKLLEDVLVGRG